jgi:hypothetical protein
MANPMQVKLVILDTTHTRLLGKTDIIASFDATRAVKTIDIDTIKFIYEDTLWYQKENVLNFAILYNSYKYVNDKIRTIKENLNLYSYYNYSGSNETDIDNETRFIKFLKPFMYLKNSHLYSILIDNFLAFPVYYVLNSPNTVGYIPFVDEGEDKYNKYDQYYQRESITILRGSLFYDKFCM